MCLQPITKVIDSVDGKRVCTFPCGHCVECVAKYQNEWSIRLAAEAKQWKYAIFCTFKYGNSRVPLADVTLTEEQRAFVNHSLASLAPNQTNNPRYNTIAYEYIKPSESLTRNIPVLFKQDMVNLFKRVRRNLQYYGIKDVNAFKYFCTGEYGPTTLRPHFHAIIFTDIYPPIIQGNLRTIWYHIAGDEGDFVHHFDTSVVRNAHSVGAYVSKYCCKPAAFENPYVVCGVIPKPCHLISKGLGNILRIELAESLKKLCAKYSIPYADPTELRKQIKQLKKLTRKDDFPSSVKFPFTKLVNFMSISPRPIPSEFAGELDDLLRQKIYTNGKVLTYSTPRYLRDWCFPQKFYYSTRYNEKTQEYEEVQTIRKDPNSSIAEARRLYIDAMLITDFKRRVDDLIFSRGMSVIDALKCATAEEGIQKDRRYRVRFERFVKFYNKNFYKNLNNDYE